MSASTDAARDVICDKAAEMARDVSGVDGLVKLADAVAKVTFGPQGGDKSDRVANRTEYTYTADTTTRHDDVKVNTSGLKATGFFG